MKILFISSGNKKEGISSITKNQGESLKNIGLDLEYFTIVGKGFTGYIKAISKLKKHLKYNKYDIFHAHYSFSGFVSSFAGARPLIVSLMGSDVMNKRYFRWIIKFFYRFFWSNIIVKSEGMRLALQLKDVKVIPNGVDFKRFRPIYKDIALPQTGWPSNKKNILFAANSARPEKNFQVAQKAFELLEKRNKIELHSTDTVPNDKMPYNYNSADVVLLSSLWEGSPNVIKEAMACNCPIVSTDVGDVKEIFGKTDGCYITSSDPKDVANKITLALKFNMKTSGRQRILQLGLDSETVAKSIIGVYKTLLKEGN